MSDHSTSAPSSDRNGVWRVFVNLLAALGVLLIGASAMALSYFAFYDRTVEAGVEDPFTYLYLGEFALLLLLAFMASYILRRGKRLHRVGVELLILLLIATGLLAVVEDMLPIAMDAQTESILFAAVPWVGLLLGAMIARWIDIELRVRRAAEPASRPATTPGSTQPSRGAGESAPVAAHDTSQNETSDSDIGWLTNKMRPEGATDEDQALPDAEGSTADPVQATDSAVPSTNSSRSTKRDSRLTRRNGSTRPRGKAKAKAKNREDEPEETASPGDDDRATATSTPMEPVAAEPPTEPLETSARDEAASDEDHPDSSTESATTAVDSPSAMSEPAPDSAADTDDAPEIAEPPTIESPEDDVSAQDEAASAERHTKELAARRLAEEVANAPDDVAASPERDSGPTVTRPQHSSDDSDGETAEADAQESTLPPLPRRTPGESAHQPRRLPPIATPVATTTEKPNDGALAPSDHRTDEPQDDVTQGLLALVDPVEEGFVPDPPYDDPTTDEGTVGENNATAPADDVPPPSTSSPTDSDDQPGDTSPADDATARAPRANAKSSVELPSRPLVRRPRRGNVDDFPPAQPPSGQVRSGPTPP